MRSWAAASAIGRRSAKLRRSPLTEVLTRGERDVATAAATALPDREANQLESVERSAGEVQFGVGELSGRVAFVVRGDLHGDSVEAMFSSLIRVSRLLRSKRSP